MEPRIRLLRIYLVSFGFLNTFILSFPAILLGDFLFWSPRNVPTELMLSSIFFAMGLIMLTSARYPLEHKSFVDFLVVANVLHGLVMVATAQQILHYLDAALVGAMGALPLFFYPWGLKSFLFGQGHAS